MAHDLVGIGVVEDGGVAFGAADRQTEQVAQPPDVPAGGSDLVQGLSQ